MASRMRDADNLSFFVNIEATAMTTYPATITMMSGDRLLHVRIWCVVAHVAWSSAFKSTFSALVRSLIIPHKPLKQSHCYDGILSHRDVILSQIPPIEVAAFVCTLQKQVARKTCAHPKFRPHEDVQ